MKPLSRTKIQNGVGGVFGGSRRNEFAKKRKRNSKVRESGPARNSENQEAESCVIKWNTSREIPREKSRGGKEEEGAKTV